MDHLNNIGTQSILIVIGLSFISGIISSIHCVGMCGPILLACSKGYKENLSYQFGRILSYTLLGLLTGLIGYGLTNYSQSNYLKLIPSFIFFTFFVYFGLENIFNFKIKFLPKIKSKNVFSKIYQLNKITQKTKLMILGFMSVLLPCGLVYSLFFLGIGLHDPIKSSLMFLFFVLGTIPGLLVAPQAILAFKNKIDKRMARVLAFGVLLYGVYGLYFRVFEIVLKGSGSCH